MLEVVERHVGVCLKARNPSNQQQVRFDSSHYSVFPHRVPYFVVWLMIGGIGQCLILRIWSLSIRSWVRYLALKADRMAIAAPLCSFVIYMHGIYRVPARSRLPAMSNLALSLFKAFKQDKNKRLCCGERCVGVPCYPAMCRVGDLLLYQIRLSQGPLF